MSIFRTRFPLFCAGLALLALLLLPGHVLALETEKVSASLVSGVLAAGDQGTLRIVIPLEKHSGNPRLHKLPEIKGLTWAGQSVSSQISIVNGRRSGKLELLLGFIVHKPGKYTIPPLRLTAGNRELVTENVSFRVTPPPDVSDEKIAAQQLAFMLLTNADDPAGKRKIFYSGETVSLLFTIFVRSPYDLLGFSRGSFFADPEKCVEIPDETYKLPPVRRTFGGKHYRGFRFRKNVRLLAPGECTVRAQFSVQISDGDRMDFFRMPSFLDEKNLSASFGPLTIRALPSLPEKAGFSGLTGQWNVNFALSPGPFRAGEPVTLRISVSGSGDLDALSPPAFAPEGFRSYPPEIKKDISAGTAEIALTLIPLSAGEKDLDLPFTVFDTAAGKYRTFRLKKTLRIEKSVLPGPPPETPAANQTEESSGTGNGAIATRGKTALPKRILYLHNENAGPGLRLPLWRNAVLPSISLIVSGLLFCAVLFLISLRKRAFENDPDLARRIAARAGKRALLRKLKNAPEGELSSELVSELSDYLNALLSLPPGAGLSGAAQALIRRDPELAGELRKLDAASWSSGAAERPDTSFRKRLLRRLAHLSVLAAALGIFSSGIALSAQETASGQTAEAFYNAGDFRKALNEYQSHRKPGEASAENLYNIGNCLYQLGDLPRALVAYERAARLAPRSPDIRENLNLTRRKLALEERHELRSPGDLPALLRDLLRLDEWILAGAAGLMLCLAGTGLFFLYGRKMLIIFCSAGILLVLLASAAVISQLSTTYNTRDALVVQKNAPVYSLPSGKSGRIEVRLKAGCEVEIDEERPDDWVRVRFGHGHEEGWMKRQSVLPFWDNNLHGGGSGDL